MKGDPLRGVHAFYAASAREWWAPLHPATRVVPPQRARRRARQAERVRRAGRARVDRRRCSATTTGTLLVRPVPADDPHRAREGPRAQEVRRRRARALHRRRDRPRSRRSTPASGPAAPSPAGGRTSTRATTVGPMVKGPLTVTDMICWHVGMGMGLYGVAPLRLGCAEPRAHPALLPPRRAQRPRRDAAGALGPGVRPALRATRPPSTTAACARRGSSTCAPTGWATTPGSGSSTASSGEFNYVGDTQWLRGTRRRASTSPTATGPRSTSSSTAENQRGEVTTPGPRHDPAAEPRARPGAAARPARRRRATSQTALDAIADGFARR